MAFHYGPRMSDGRPELLLDRPAPDVAPLGPDGAPFPIRQFVGRSPLVLFFFSYNNTPG
jgi:hypothetical protein